MDQIKVPPVKPELLAVRSTDPPSQKICGPFAVISGFGGIGLTTTLILSDTSEAQTSSETKLTAYFPEVVTVKGLSVDPVDQVKVPPVKSLLLAVRSTEPPSQNIIGPLAVISGFGGIGLTTTLILSDTSEEQTSSETKLTEYIPEVVTVKGLSVDPVDQVKVPPVKSLLLAIRSTEPPSQNTNGPLAVISGFGGIGFTTTVILSEVPEGQTSLDI
ncbi:hypothetical protein MYP_3387 [Sporocytophaga myxococcoides]|uniref:Uncharacterized protein n=1 Tax=Sporocytophaga myxococcoides TaxID=153721 RepID=A0A098LJ18_9BACT|nr:hypothetical protein MYP_3387 [Sporocytophaga myxococcoides]